MSKSKDGKVRPVDARLQEVLDALTTTDLKLDRLVRDVEGVFPFSVVAAFQARRPELLYAGKADPLSAEATAAVLRLLGALLETNLALRTHASELATLVSTWMQCIRGLETSARRIEHFGNFRACGEEGDAD